EYKIDKQEVRNETKDVIKHHQHTKINHSYTRTHTRQGPKRQNTNPGLHKGVQDTSQGMDQDGREKQSKACQTQAKRVQPLSQGQDEAGNDNDRGCRSVEATRRQQRILLNV